jgi:hypothetical protein
MEQTFVFDTQAVKNFTSADFLTETRTPIILKADGCWTILFYDNTKESMDLADVFAEAAKMASLGHFGAVNLKNEKTLADVFVNLQGENNPLSQFAPNYVPFIMTYQKNWPVGIYKGDLTSSAIADFSRTIACSSDYFDPGQEILQKDYSSSKSTTGPKSLGVRKPKTAKDFAWYETFNNNTNPTKTENVEKTVAALSTDDVTSYVPDPGLPSAIEADEIPQM